MSDTDRVLTASGDFAKEPSKVEEDTRVDVFVCGRTEKQSADVRYDVEEGRELGLTIVDLTPADVDMNVEINLAFRSRAEIRVASVCQTGNTKNFAVNVNHNGQQSYSRTFMAGINQGDGVLNFLGKSFIANGAHRSDTRQDGKITNLSRRSKSEVSPALLINDDDVKASHGAALGAYDPDAIFYMMSRGLTEEQSKKLITVGNIMPVIDAFRNTELAGEAKKALGEMGL